MISFKFVSVIILFYFSISISISISLFLKFKHEKDPDFFNGFKNSFEFWKQLNEEDLEVLVSLFENTNGKQWKSKGGDIVSENTRVIKVDLNGCNLRGYFFFLQFKSCCA